MSGKTEVEKKKSKCDSEFKCQGIECELAAMHCCIDGCRQAPIKLGRQVSRVKMPLCVTDTQTSLSRDSKNCGYGIGPLWEQLEFQKQPRSNRKPLYSYSLHVRSNQRWPLLRASIYTIEYLCSYGFIESSTVPTEFRTAVAWYTGINQWLLAFLYSRTT